MTLRACNIKSLVISERRSPNAGHQAPPYAVAGMPFLGGFASPIIVPRAPGPRPARARVAPADVTNTHIHGHLLARFKDHHERFLRI